MFHLLPSARIALSPEALAVAQGFLDALPPTVERQIISLRLFGPQALRFELDAPFELLVVVESRGMEVRTALGIGRAAVEAEGQHSATLTIVTAGEAAAPPERLERALRNARREGVDLWARAAA